MTETLPVPVAPAGAPPDAWMAALAMAAARIAAEQARAPVATPLTRDEVEAIAREAVAEAFLKFGVDLTKVESVEAHRAVLDHAKRSLVWWGKAAGTVWTGIWTAIGAALIAAVVKYTSMGGGR